MIYRKLGPTGIKVSVIGFGNWINSNTQEAQLLTNECVKTAWDLGINFFDTAQLYGFGEAERQMGRALKALEVPRHQFVLTTKLFFGTKEPIPNRKGLSRKHIIEGMKTSLKNLDYDYVDVVYCHRYDDSVPMQETCRAFDWVIRKGWAFYWGTSQWTQNHIAEAHMVCDKYNLIKPVVEQPQYNIFERQNVEVKYRRLFEKGLLGTTIFSPLAGGTLTGKYNNGIPEGSRLDTNPDVMKVFHGFFQGNKKQKTIESLNKFADVAKDLECSMAQLAMAWVISNPDISTAITGVTKSQQLKDTVKSLQVLPKLTADIQKRIEDIFGSEPPAKMDHKTLGPIPNRRRKLLNY